MTQRQRQSATAVSEAVPRPLCVEPPPHRLPAQASDPPSWDELFHSATHSQQTELLSLARRQGILYSSQLPAAAPPKGDEERSRHFLSRLFHAQAPELPSFHQAAIEFIDNELDDSQRDAVGKALSTPDIFLLEGLPGTGKSRVVVEIVLQAFRRGERVLILAPGASAADRILEEVGSRDGVLAVRCLAAEESLEELPAAVRALTVGERLRVLKQETLVQARREVDRAQERCERLRQDGPVLNRCQQLAEDWQQLEAQLATLAESRRELSGKVEREAAAAESSDAAEAFAAQLGTLSCAFQESDRRLESKLQDLGSQLASKEGEVASLVPDLTALHPLAEAKERGRWWQTAWWQATFSGNVLARRAELQTRQDQSQASLNVLRTDIDCCTQERQQAKQLYCMQRQGLIDAEIAVRQAALDRQEALLGQDRALLQQKWDGACGELSPETPRPAEPAREAVEGELLGWRQRGEQDDRQLAFARDWLAGLESMVDRLPQELAAHANLFAATSIQALDRQFAATGLALSFDMLILESAHDVTESEFSGAARRARRWTLVGEPSDAHGPRRSADAGDATRESKREARTPESKDRSSRTFVPQGVLPAGAPAFFERLWARVHFDPRQLPYHWCKENDRLCCRFRSIAIEQRPRLESERVADFPEIELRILNSPDARPTLAEVVFPPAMTIAKAKQYIYQELQELSIRAAGSCMRWREDGERILLHLSEVHDHHGEAITLERGVRELTCGTAHGGNGAEAGWTTCCLEFDRRSGWHRQRAEEWLARHLGARDVGRSVRLEVPYRMHGDLAAALSDYQFARSYRLQKLPHRSAAAGTNGQAPVQFVAVPAAVGETTQSKAANGRRAAPPRPRVAKGGAGLELDLSDTRHRDRLPSEYRAELPSQGLVNYLEAQAVVRALELVAAEPAWAGAKRNGQSGRCPTIGVLALYPAQAELIQRLIQRSPALTAWAGHIRVGVPMDFRESECEIVLLSLTRSHNHRAVSFGRHPREITLALTRARSRVIIFGDPGTLARRAEWDGPVDHLDEVSAAHEQQWVAHIVRRHVNPEQSPTRAESRPQGSRS